MKIIQTWNLSIYYIIDVYILYISAYVCIYTVLLGCNHAQSLTYCIGCFHSTELVSHSRPYGLYLRPILSLRVSRNHLNI